MMVMDSVHNILLRHLEDQVARQFIASPSKLGVPPGLVMKENIIISGGWEERRKRQST